MNDLLIAILKTLAGIFMYGSIPAMVVYFGIRANTKKIQASHLKKNIFDVVK